VTFLWRTLSVKLFWKPPTAVCEGLKKKGLMLFLFEKKEEPLQDVPSAVLTGSR
jgi:hypothetical protein